MSEVRDVLFKEFNKHGYALPQAILRKFEELSLEQRTNWVLEAVEFPVAVNDRHTRVDILLKNKEDDTLLVGECKRVDPRLGRWGFARNKYTHRNPTQNPCAFEKIIVRDDGTLSSVPWFGSMSDAPYHVYVPFKTQAKGDGGGGGRDAIEDACSQVVLGAMGLCERFRRWGRLTGGANQMVVMPTIFTTADLWATDADLSNADLSSGRLSSTESEAEKKDWLWLNYNLSPAFQHGIEVGEDRRELHEVLERDLIRSVAVVNTNGLDAFLRKRFHGWD